MYDLVSALNSGVTPGFHVQMGTEITVLPDETNGPEVMMSYYDHWHNVTAGVQGVPTLLASMALQPVPKRLAQTALDKGGDLMNLDADHDRMILEFDYFYVSDSSDGTVSQAIEDVYTGMRERVTGFQAQGKLPSDVYLPLFINDANYREDYFGRLNSDSQQLARSVQARLDPNGLWKTRTGGFKLEASMQGEIGRFAMTSLDKRRYGPYVETKY